MQITATLLSAASATGSGVIVAHGGDYVFLVAGTFGGTSVGLQILGPDGVTWISIEDSAGAIAVTSAKAVYMTLPAGTYRATITGGTSPEISAELRSA